MYITNCERHVHFFDVKLFQALWEIAGFLANLVQDVLVHTPSWHTGHCSIYYPVETLARLAHWPVR
jgi:hypothetical protein